MMNIGTNCTDSAAMKNKFLAALVVLSLFFAARTGLAAEETNAATELKALMAKIQPKLKDVKTEQDLAPELKEFDALLAKHQGEKTDDVARILLMKAKLYLQIFDDTDKGFDLVRQLKRDFPETKLGKNADEMLDAIGKQEEARRIQNTLVPGKSLPDFKEADMMGHSLSIGNYRGKVVLVDFWGTWYEPWLNQLPGLLKTYEKHHGQGFEIIGICLDADREAVTKFVKEKKIAWPQFFDGNVWLNKVAVKYGEHKLPANYLLDGQGKIIARNLRPEELEPAITKALGKP
jgi:peroxiredoxin